MIESDIYHIYIGWINKALLNSRGNYIQYFIIHHKGKKYKKNVHMCITESLHCAV